MTVISVLINKYCTVHASDSYLTVPHGQELQVVESQETKIVRAEKYRGALAYFGLAKSDDFNWSTLTWLQSQVANSRYDQAEDFARSLTDNLNGELAKMQYANPLAKGIGIHFTTYERFDDLWIPELFAATNFSSTAYESLHVEGVICTRQTFNVVMHNMPSLPEHREREFRLMVHYALHRADALLVYNNGDPLLFNPVAGAIFDSLRITARRGELSDTQNPETYRRIAKTAVKVVCDIQQAMVEQDRQETRKPGAKTIISGKRRIGGKSHALAISPNGSYLPVSGD